jgi:hypothetical protein
MIKDFLSKTFSVPDEPVQEIPEAVPVDWSETQFWKPLHPKKKMVFNQRLDAQNFNRHRFKPQAMAFFSMLAFLLLFGFFLYQSDALRQIEIGTMPNVILIGFTLGLGFNIFKVIQALTPVVFDKPSGYFWKGWQKPWNGKMGNKARLRDIVALQIIHKTVSAERGTVTMFELNILLKNNERLNVIDQANFKVLSEDAQQLSRFLGVPLWNAVKLKRF